MFGSSATHPCARKPTARHSARTMAPKGTRKRPAAAKDTWLHGIKKEPAEDGEPATELTLAIPGEQPAAKRQAPLMHQEEDEPGEGVDDRQTSLAQRHVFKLSRDKIDKDILEKYDWYKSKECKEKGKEKLANQIVNAVVPRNATWGSSVKPSSVTLERIMQRTTKEAHSDMQTGLPKRIFIASIFHGDTAAFEASRDAGECWEEADGKWFYDSRTRSFTDEKVKRDTGAARYSYQMKGKQHPPTYQ